MQSDVRSSAYFPRLRACSTLNGPFQDLAGVFHSPQTSDEDAFGCG